MEKHLWHALELKKVFEILHTSDQGLSSKESEQRLKKIGANKLPEAKKLSKLIIILSQFKSPLVYILIFAALIAIFLQDYIDAGVILIAILINTIFGFYQENKANNSIAYLRKLVQFKARVLRDGNEKEINTAELVPGDVIFLEAGDKIPADSRLLKVDNLQIVEASLTGEPVPAKKKLATLDKGAVLAERFNMVYSGTVVASGRGMAIVCDTGINTQIGEITRLVKETVEEDTPLQSQLKQFSRYLTYAVLFFMGFIIVLGKLQGRQIFGFGHEARESLLNVAAATAVAAIPEGLLIAVTVILAVGMQAILREKALIRRLIATETLGSVSIICTDKTGTLTEGRMQVSQVITAGEELDIKKSLPYQAAAKLKDHDLIVKMSLLCNNAVVENPDEGLEKWKIIGDPTETALLLAALQSGAPEKEIKEAQPRLQEVPFDSEWKYMATLNKLDKKRNVIYVKGAPEVVFKMASKIRINGKKVKLTVNSKKELTKKYEELTAKGLRLLAFCYKQTNSTKKIDIKDELNDLIFAGFIALKDPLRDEARETFRLTKQAGIRPIIITGDHRLTAKAIVSELGLDVAEKNIIEGEELDKISDEELMRRLPDIDIYARVEPKHKLRIVHAWQKMGETVAMTGDGVNDAPAIKAADIGIALGDGTDVAKETSDMILLDNNFKTIVAAIERGRVIFENIKKVTLYLLVGSFTEIILISGSLILGFPIPILPAQIIWVNLITDGFPSFALTFEKGEEGVMKEKPRPRNERILDKEMKILIFVIGIFTDLVLLGIFYLMLDFTNMELIHIRTFVFAALAINSLFYVFSCRSLRHTIISKNPFDNKFLIFGVIMGFILQLAAIYQPQLQKVFATVPLSLNDWILIFGLGIFNIMAIEVVKYYFIVKKANQEVKIS